MEPAQSIFATLSFLDWLTIAAFIMSSATWAMTFLHHRRSLSLKTMDHTSLMGGLQLYVCIENHSRLPISISSISLYPSDERFCIEPRRIKEKGVIRGRTETVISVMKTPQFPLNLPPLESLNCYLELEEKTHIRPTDGTILTFQMLTNRGRIRKKATLGPTSIYLHHRKK